jgi:hypothetical protein
MTIAKAMKDILFFLMLLAAMLVGFYSAAHYAFGGHAERFSSLSLAFMS